VKRVVVFYGNAEGDMNAWKRASPPDHSLDLVALRPSDPSRSATNPLPYSISYGVHHSKIFLIGYSDDTCRVVIHTANMRYEDIHLKAQSAYIQDFPLKATCSDPTTDLSSEFEVSLVTYLSSYEFSVRRNWSPRGKPELLTDAVRRYDFTPAKAVLIPSIPGHHKLDAVETYGHWKLRTLVATCTFEPRLQEAVRPIVCQFSSIGSLTEKYLRDLQISMDTGLSRSYRHQSPAPTIPLRLQLVYPTVKEIRLSVEGYRGGRSVPGTVKHVSKPFLRKLWHKWSGNKRNPLGKPKNVPHVKSYYQVCRTSDSMDWLVITSHNLSKAAWGEVQTSNRFGGRRLFIRHWELGVFLSPLTLKSDRLVCWTGADNGCLSGTITAAVPMPFSLLPESYDSSDTPWAVDSTYEAEDGFGLSSAIEGIPHR
jgi:tyrosyl-DNA phosphodiesterase 1